MPIEISTQIIHASFATVINKIEPNANIYDNPNQQGTTYPAWFIVHRSPVEVQREIGKRLNGNRYLITYQIDLWYMLKQNITRLFDQYTQIAEQLEYHLQYLPIFGSDAVVHVYDQSWSLELNALKYSVTLRLKVYTDENFVFTPMQVIEDLSIFLKNQKESIVSFSNETHPEFDITLPNPLSVTTGRYVNLPFVTGRYEEDGVYLIPSGWSLGKFGALIQVNENVTANLIWGKETNVYPQGQFTYGEMILNPSIIMPLNAVEISNIDGQIMEVSGIQETQGIFIEDNGLDWLLSQNDIMDVWNVPAVTRFVCYPTNSGSSGDPQPAGSSFTMPVYDDEGNLIPYDSTKSYGVVRPADLDGDFAVINNSGNLAVQRSNGTNTGEISSFECAECESNESVIATVYGEDGRLQNAFKYRTNNKDYYYVLDGERRYWLANLSKIYYYVSQKSYASAGYDTIRIASVDGTVIYAGMVTNTLVRNYGYYNVYSNNELTEQYEFNPEKRYIFGFYGDPQEEVFIPFNYQLRSDMPPVANVDSSLIHIISQTVNQVHCLDNAAERTIEAEQYVLRRMRVYANNTHVKYFNDLHNPVEIVNGQSWKTDVPYDYKKKYELLLCLVKIPNEEAIRTYETYWNSFDFFDYDGFVGIRYKGSSWVGYPWWLGISFYASREAFFTNLGELSKQDSIVSTGDNINLLYDKDGEMIPFDDSAEYIIDRFCKYNTGSSSAFGFMPRIVSQTINNNKYLAVQLNSTDNQILGFKVEYTEIRS